MRARIQHLADALVDAPDLPAAVAHDLRRAVVALEAETARLQTRLHALEQALEAADMPSGLEDAVAQVQARLRRLRTLQRAGSPVDEDEIARLEQAQAGQLADLAHREDLERRHVAATARLLELGAAANEARRDLFDTTTPSQPLTDVVARLQRDTAAAKAALDEVDATERARRAAASRATSRR